MLLVESSQAVVTENLSTISMGVEHFGQRKQVGWAGEEVTTSGDGTGKAARQDVEQEAA